MIETEARKIWNEAAKETALRMLQDGELPTDRIAKYSGLSISEVKHLKNMQPVLGTERHR